MVVDKCPSYMDIRSVFHARMWPPEAAKHCLNIISKGKCLLQVIQPTRADWILGMGSNDAIEIALNCHRKQALIIRGRANPSNWAITST
jgi:hypothetical protein